MKPILDVCCGSRMFWFNKADERAVFGDIRKESHILCDGRELIISPDQLIDFRHIWSTLAKEAGCARSTAHLTEKPGATIYGRDLLRHFAF